MSEEIRQDAYLNDIRLDCEIISDVFPKAIAKHEFPYRDEAFLEDMGMKTHTVRVRCYFFNETYETHKDLVSLLKDRQKLQLTHPVYGILNGTTENVSIRHDDRESTAAIDFTFIEGRTEAEQQTANVVDADSEDQYEKGLNEAQESMEDDMDKALGAESKSIMDETLDADKGILEQFTDLSRKARNYVKKVDTAVSKFEATLNDIATPANALISTIDFAANLPGRVIGSIAGTVHRYSELYESIKDAPERFINSLKDGLQELENAFPQGDSDNDAATHIWRAVQTVSAIEMGVQAGGIYGRDEERRMVQKRLETVKSFDASGKLVKAATPETVMNIREVERTLYTVREQMQTAIDTARPNNSMKQMAALLLEHVNIIKLEREKIITIELDNEMPLHLICLKYGLPYQAAQRILAINPQIKNPNQCPKRMDIYVG